MGRRGAHRQVPAPQVLDNVAQAMAAHPNARIRVEGHTDNTRAREANQSLSQARADSTRTYLVSKGIDSAHRRRSAGAWTSPSRPTSDRKAAARTDARSSSSPGDDAAVRYPADGAPPAFRG
jgi:outer membrane protein OmpA-like peptidoglycan-associated protein